MKPFPRNVWTSRLTDRDWNFSACPVDEWGKCFEWEFARELCQRENDGSFPPNRKVYPVSDEDLLRSGGELPGPTLPHYWIHHPDFPASSYIEYRTKENFRVNEPVEEDLSSLISYQWDGVDQLREIEDPDNYGGGMWAGKNTTVHAFQIHWNYPTQMLEKAFRDWLRYNRPHYSEGEGIHYKKGDPIIPEPPKEIKKTGASSDVRQWKAALKKLGAWRVLQHRGNVYLAMSHPNIKTVLGKQFCGTKRTPVPTAWTELKKAVEKILKEKFAEWT